MEPIIDFSWMQHMLTGRVREKFTYNDYRAVALEIPEKNINRSPYHYRILFFSDASQKPVLSLNLESSILGSYCYTEHSGNSHVNLGQSDEGVSYEDFKKWALQRAERDLH